MLLYKQQNHLMYIAQCTLNIVSRNYLYYNSEVCVRVCVCVFVQVLFENG